jgi:hypothetical protein
MKSQKDTKITELSEFTRKGWKDPLADLVDELVCAPDMNFFYQILSERKRGGKGKSYTNRDGKLPNGGRYEEFEVNGAADSRRIVVDMDSLDVFATRDHYDRMLYAGSPDFKDDFIG